MRSSCIWVADPDGHAREAARNTAEIATGRICVVPSPTDQRTVQVQAHDLLLALGKDLTLPGVFRNAQHRWLTARSWLIGDAVTDLHVVDADVLTVRQRERYIALSVETGLRLWLIAGSQPIGRDARKQLRNWAADTATAADFVAQLPPVSVTDIREDPAELPADLAFPEDDFYVFRAVCRRELGTAVFAHVDAWWQHGFHSALSWDLPTSDVPPAVAGQVRTLLNAPMARGQALVTTRGVQAALFLRGVLMRISLGRFLYEMTTQSAGAPTNAGILQLRRFANPALAAVGLIVWLTDAGPSELQAIRLDDVDADGSALRFGDHELTVPARAHGILRALLVARRLGPPGAEHELFALQSQTEGVTTPATTNALRRWLAIVADATDLPFLRRDTIVKDHGTNNWITRRGMSVVTL